MENTVIVYHGSNHRFDTIRIKKDKTKESSKLNEGYGIYFSLDRSVAESYGKYVYTLEIPAKCLKDFRKRVVCRSFLNGIVSSILKETGVNISNFVCMNDILDCMLSGQISIVGVDREISLILDSSERFYNLNQKDIDKILNMLDGLASKMLKNYAYMFPYNISQVGIAKSESIVRVVKREKMY